MPTYLTPGVYFEISDPAEREIGALRTDVAAFVGLAVKGPLHTPTRVQSWEQFQALFGGISTTVYLAPCVRAFFENGGLVCWIVRTAATPRTVADIAAVQPAGGSFTVVESTTGFSTGNLVHVAQGPLLRRVMSIASVDPILRRILWEDPLDAVFDPNDPILALEIRGGALPAFVDLPGADGQPSLRIEAASPGTWGNALSVRVAHDSRAVTRTVPGLQPATGETSIVESLAGFAPGALCRVFQAQQPSIQPSYRIVRALDPLRREIHWNVPLAPAFQLNDPANPIALETLEFSLTVLVDRAPFELFQDLTLNLAADPPARRAGRLPIYVEDAINGLPLQDEVARERLGRSALIRVTDLDSPAPQPQPLPPSGGPPYQLSGGCDGLAALTIDDFTGVDGLPERTGLRTLELIDEPSGVAIPDLFLHPNPPPQFAPPPPDPGNPCLLSCEPPPPPPPAPLPPVPATEQPPEFSLDDIFLAEQRLIEHCETAGDRIAVLDPPVQRKSVVVQETPFIAQTELQVLEPAEMTAWRQRFDSKYAAIYYPWLDVPDLRGALRRIPPCGHALGAFAAIDAEIGVHAAPANRPLAWAQALSLVVDAATQGILNPAGINVIRPFPGRGFRINGARTLSSDGSWRFVNVRRLLNMIEEAIERSIAWAVFEPNNLELRRAVAVAIGSFLETLRLRGALAGATADEAFQIKIDGENNPPDALDSGLFLAEVAVAPAIPAEFVVIRIGQTRDGLALTEIHPPI